MFHALPRLYFKTGWTLVETTLKREELWVFEEQHTHIALLLSAVTALNQICFAELQQSQEIAFLMLLQGIIAKDTCEDRIRFSK